MGADATLVQGAYKAYAAPEQSPADVWNDLAKIIRQQMVDNVQAIAKKRKEHKLKVDTFHQQGLNGQNQALQGHLSKSYPVVVNDMEFQAEIYGTVTDDNTAAASLQIMNQQSQADSKSISTTLDEYNRILSSPDYKGAGISNSVLTGDFMEQWVNPDLSMKYVFEGPNGEIKEVVNSNPEDAAWLADNKEVILDGEWKQTESRYGLVHTTQEEVEVDVIDDVEWISNPAYEAYIESGETLPRRKRPPEYIANETFGKVIGTEIETRNVYTWKSAEEVNDHLNMSLEDIETRGELADIAADYRAQGVSWLNADPGRYEEGKGYIRPDARSEMNVALIRQDVAGVFKDKKDHQMRSIITDPVIGNTSLIEHLEQALLADINNNALGLDDALIALEDGDGNAVFGIPGEGNPGVDTATEITNMINTIALYDFEDDGVGAKHPKVKKAVNKMVEEYYVQWVRDQFIIGTNNTYRPGGGVGAYGEETIDTGPLFTYIDEQ